MGRTDGRMDGRTDRVPTLVISGAKCGDFMTSRKPDMCGEFIKDYVLEVGGRVYVVRLLSYTS